MFQTAIIATLLTTVPAPHGGQIRANGAIPGKEVRHTDPATGEHWFSPATSEQMAVAAGQPSVAACSILDPYRVIKSPVSWIEAVRFFTRLGRSRVAITTTFYFDPPSDYHLFVSEYDSGLGMWKEVYSGQYATSANETGLDTGDLNGDGLPDVVVGHETGITAFLDDGTGGYVRLAADSGDLATVLVVADINGDTKLDVISLPWIGPITVRYGDGTGRFPSKESVPGTFEGYNDMELGDVDGDGRDELLVMSGQSIVPNFTVYELAPGLPFVGDYWVASPPENVSGIAALDFTADGRLDVALSKAYNRPESGVWTYAQSGGGTLIEPPGFVPSYDIPESLEVGDLTCTGPGLIVAHGGWMALGFFPTLPTGGFDFETLCPLPYASHYDSRAGLAVGDGDGDGALDVFVADYNYGGLWLRGTTVCCVPGTSPDLLKAVKSGAAKDVTFTWGPVAVTSGTIWRVPVKSAIPGVPVGAVEVCSGPSPSCTSAGEMVGPRESFFQVLAGAGCRQGERVVQ